MSDQLAIIAAIHRGYVTSSGMRLIQDVSPSAQITNAGNGQRVGHVALGGFNTQTSRRASALHVDGTDQGLAAF